MLGTIDAVNDLQAEDRIGVFSYGSGSCAEYYCFKYTSKSKEIAAKAGLKNLIENRTAITVADYEAMEKQRDIRIQEGDYNPFSDALQPLYDNAFKGKGLLTYTGSKGYYRTYEFS